MNVSHHMLIQGDMDLSLVMLRDNGSGDIRDVGVDTVLYQEAIGLGLVRKKLLTLDALVLKSAEVHSRVCHF